MRTIVSIHLECVNRMHTYVPSKKKKKETVAINMS